jgi:hypothetical protein
MTSRERSFYGQLNRRLTTLACQANALAHPPIEHPMPAGEEARIRADLLHGLRDLAAWIGVEPTKF